MKGKVERSGENSAGGGKGEERRGEKEDNALEFN